MNRSLVIICSALVLFAAVQPITVYAKKDNSNEQGSTNGQPFKTLRAMIDLVSQDLAAAIITINNRITDAENNLQQQIDDQGDILAAHDQLISIIQVSINNLESRVAANEGDIAALQAVDALHIQLISALDTNLVNLEARVADNESDILALFQADATLQQMITANQNRISTLTSRINSNDADIASLQQEIINLEADIATLNVELSNKQNRITGVCPSGSSIRKISYSGGVSCEVDTVSAGVGRPSVTRISKEIELQSAGLYAGQNIFKVHCPSSYKVTGGGFGLRNLTDFSDLRFIHVYAATTEGNGYVVGTFNDNVVIGNNGRVAATAFAQCMKII